MQGIAIDPLMNFIAILTQEGQMKVYKNKNLNKKIEFFHKHTIKGKESLNISEEEDAENNKENKDVIVIDDEAKEEEKKEEKKVFK